MIKQGLKQPWVLILLCIVIHAGIGLKFGLVAFVAVTPFFAALMARPLMDWAAQIRREFREHVWRDVRGRHFSFRDVAVGVLEDTKGGRWVCADDVRKLVPAFAADARLEVGHDAAVRAMGEPLRPFVRADVLLTWLQPMSARRARRFRDWLRREVVYPSSSAARQRAAQPVVGHDLRRESHRLIRRRCDHARAHLAHLVQPVEAVHGVVGSRWLHTRDGHQLGPADAPSAHQASARGSRAAQRL